MMIRTIALTLTATVAATALSGLLLPYQVEHSEIATADRETAWAVIADLENYPTWNPHVVHLAGEATVGTRLVNHTRSGNTEITFHPEVLIAEPNRELRWRGSLGMRGLADGEHYYRIDPGPTPEQITITQGEVFRGVLVTLLRPWFKLDEEFAVSTKALAAHVEKQG
ncbi:MAG: SRPBCC domain-containing protein [Corynebacterium sp.]|uniref:SRPBCC domain-containing protein n=1 Tax=Corynebacterium sp. TaxID=1720 RepID=UPI0026DEF542|nr:SRPBCC domain-containing protein [Corynebacterium sp.]MDO5669110.1 SRPBCC domain-containing protein [Corynebacterium sp.]